MANRSFRRIALLATVILFPGHALTEEAQRWGSVLNPSGEAPLGAFKAVYFNTQNPREIIASETVPDVAINYAWDAFFGIKSEDFGAYWVGRIKVPQEEQRTLELSQSWSQARVFIDGSLVHESRGDTRKPITLTKGNHLVEVEFINNWHTTSFRAALKKAVEPLTREQVLEKLRARKLANAQVYFVGVYESSAKDLSIQVDVARGDQPIILVFSAYDAVKWTVKEAQRGNVAAVVYGGSGPASEVQGLDERKTLVLPLAGSIGAYRLEANCSCHATVYHCESDGNLLATQKQVEAMTGARLVSFSGEYSAKAFSLPGLTIDATAQELARSGERKQQAERERCLRQANPDFNKMFEKKNEG